MSEFIDFRILDSFCENPGEEELNLLFKRLINQIKTDLDSEPIQKNVKILIKESKISNQIRNEDIINIGVKR